MYSTSNRAMRSESLDYLHKDVDEIFTQNTEKKIHESMSCNGLKLREARDSETHPTTIPIILNLDVTGSMGQIPHDLVKTGLPKMMGSMIQRGVKDAALLFTAIGDHEIDRYPLQVGQFESGDEELDMWLTRTYLEGGGGGNMGESYLLAWYLAAFHTKTDSFEKRGQKGFLFTIGDEPGLTSIPETALKEIFGDGQHKTWTDAELLEKAREKWHVFHLLIERGWRASAAEEYWKKTLGQDCIPVKDIMKIPEMVSDIVTATLEKTNPDVLQPSTDDSKPSTDGDETSIIL
jgi:hypothetical protein